MKETEHPYIKQPRRAFWSKSVAEGWTPLKLFEQSGYLLTSADRVASAGSCFAANLVPHLEFRGFTYVRTEQVNADGRFNYGHYSAGYGNIYTARQFRQLVERSLGRFSPAEDRWVSQNGIIDPFRPGMPFPAENDAEFNLIRLSHLSNTRDAFGQASVLLFTLGLSEAWISKIDGAVFPACPGVVAGVFDAKNHGFVNFSAGEIAEDLIAAILQIRETNPSLRVILTVSPVPLVATATNEHVYVANFYSKAALRAAAGQVASQLADVVYFPSLEIVMGLDCKENFAPDLRNVSESGIKKVLDTFLANCEQLIHHNKKPHAGSSEILSKSLARRECEEVMNEPRDLDGQNK